MSIKVNYLMDGKHCAEECCVMKLPGRKHKNSPEVIRGGNG
jgi:hypothetical protein